MKKPPILARSPLTDRVFIATSYRRSGDNTVEVRTKHDVTEAFRDIAAALGYVQPATRPKHGKDRSREYRERAVLRAAMWRIADECPHLRSEISALVDTNRFGAWRQYIANHHANTGVATEAA